MKKYKKLTYLLGCYMSVADKEINALEIDVLDNYLSDQEKEELCAQRQLIFSDDEDKPNLSSLISELKLSNTTMQQKQEAVKLLADVAYGDDYMAKQEKLLLEEVSKALKIDASGIIAESESLSKERMKSTK